MSQEQKYTLDEAQRVFAKQLNGRVWDLLEKEDRSLVEDEEMLHAAHASLYHWLQVGDAVHHQRGEWLLSRVHVVLGHVDAAQRHARRCLELTQRDPDEMADFDVAYAYEGVARAHALAGDWDEAQTHRHRARLAGESIANEEDRAIFFGDLDGGDWFGVP
jgi:hypothetical protein